MKILDTGNIISIKNSGIKEMYLINSIGEKIIFPEQNGEIILNKTELIKDNLIEKRRLTFYDNEDDSLILVDEESIILNCSDQVNSNSTESFVTIYIDNEGVLCILKNSMPSNGLYFRNESNVTKINSVDNKLVIEFEFNTLRFVPEEVYGSFLLRGSKDKEKFSIKIIESHKIYENVFKNKCKLELSSEKINRIIPKIENIRNYMHYVLDLEFSFKFKEFNHIQKNFKLKYSKLNENRNIKDVWLDLNEDIKVLVRPYSTLHGTFSMRIGHVPSDIVEYHKSHKKIKVKNDKPVIVIYEYPEKAQENGLEFFKYLVENHKENYDIYFIVGNFSQDLLNLENYKDHVVYFRTEEHIDLLYKADILCHTHTSYFFLPYQTEEFMNLLKSKKRVFLQHGVLGARNLKNMYGKSVNDWVTDLFIVSSDRERKIVNGYGFSDNEIVISGLPRFDKLVSERKQAKNLFQKKKLLIMPTWRPSHANLSDLQFKNTNYYKIFNKLLNHKKFKIITKLLNYDVVFYQHRNFQKFNELFSSDYVKIISQEDFTVQELLLESDVLITDYSSVGLDFVLMNKKVIYLQPKIITEKHIQSLDARFFPGPIHKDFESIAKELAIPRLNDEIRKNLSFIYEYKDTNARKRIFDRIKELFKI